MDNNKILLIEDEPVTAMAEKDELEQYDFDVDVVYDGEKSFEYLDEEPDIDLILMDIELKGEKDGIELAQEIQENKDIPILFLTSHKDPEYINRVMGTKSYNYLVKENCNGPMLNNAIHQALKLYRSKKKIKKQNKYLKRKEQEYKKIFNAADDPMVMIKDSKLYLVNRAFTNLTGYNEDNILGKPIDQISIFKKLEQNLNEVQLDNGNEIEFKSKVSTYGDTERYIKFQLVEIEIDYESAYILILHDYTKQVELMEKIEKRKKIEGEEEDLVTICSNCKRIRDNQQEEIVWMEPEKYIYDYLADIDFSHGICSRCIKELYPGYYDRVFNDEEE